ncbi:hypothetical protein Zmor_002742 [Zophobas morio]|mgnify:CR=1 FL=1|uniref:Reverse transcriptase domain-containing protein n=1 Tax=Zophobas morio TaxID=2755281 RepID=A0AA38M0U3_9CUCU|nr:hypothetical protein Zmor_002742 [Zophobas morio]
MVSSGQVRSGRVGSDQVKSGRLGSLNCISKLLEHILFCLRSSYRVSSKFGVPQGLVLGPLLWIDVYDDLLKLKIAGVTQVGFADDRVLIFMAETQSTLEYIVNRALDMVVRWMEIRKMELALEKTKTLTLYGPRKRDSVRFKIRNTEIRPSKEAHIRYATDKAEKSIVALGKLMANVAGPMDIGRKILLNGVANCIYSLP